MSTALTSNKKYINKNFFNKGDIYNLLSKDNNHDTYKNCLCVSVFDNKVVFHNVANTLNRIEIIPQDIVSYNIINISAHYEKLKEEIDYIDDETNNDEDDFEAPINGKIYKLDYLGHIRNDRYSLYCFDIGGYDIYIVLSELYPGILLEDRLLFKEDIHGEEELKEFITKEIGNLASYPPFTVEVYNSYNKIKF